jgi:DNA-binding NarL/FixJ family response regulator
VAVRCLIVDDNADFLEAARELLEREGVDIVGVASNSSEALQQAADLQPEVTLVDIYLGNESGFDLARSLAARADGKDSVVILISTYAERDLADVIAASPALGFLSKSDLSRRAIDALLGRSNPKP